MAEGQGIKASDNRLWGRSGGELEYVSQHIEYQESSVGVFFPVMVMTFTDHDIQPDGGFYELRFRIFSP